MWRAMALALKVCWKIKKEGLLEIILVKTPLVSNCAP